MALLARLLVAGVLLLAAADAWKWKSLFDDSDADSVVTVAADGRGVYPVFRTFSGYRTLLLRLPAAPDFGPAVVTRVRHVYSLPGPPPPPPPPPTTRYGPPVAAPAARAAAGVTPNSAAATAAAVAASVARTILEAHGFGRSFDLAASRLPAAGADGRDPWTRPRDSYSPVSAEQDPWQGRASWRRRR